MLKTRKNKDFHDFLKEENINNIRQKYGTPCHIIFPTAFSKNIDNFKQVLESAEIKYQIFYAHKSNKNSIFLENCKEKDIGVDIASIGEGQNTIKKNIENVEASGPKNKTFLDFCIEHKIPIAVDSFSELNNILYIKKEKCISNKIEILVRISGFSNSVRSRFGIEISEKKQIINFLKTNSKDLKFLGFSFHIDTESIEEKALALEEILELYNDFIKKDLRARIINIGGGFGISYLENESDWRNYKELLRSELQNPKLEISWKKQSYGFEKSKNSIIGNGKFYAPFRKDFGEGYLRKILEFPLKKFGGLKVQDFFQENFLTLWLEPGRSLHDFTAISLTEVISVKEIQEEILVVVDSNSFQLGSREQELFADPILFSKNIKTSKKGVFIAGNLCLESDFISKHKIFFGKIPQVGDTLAFINTGGYLMDFYETKSISHELPKKIIYYSENKHYAL